MIELAEPDSIYAYLVLAMMLGLRRGELLGLDWSDVDLGGGSLQVVHTLQRVDDALHLVPPKTMSSVRTVPLPALCVEALRRQVGTGPGEQGADSVSAEIRTWSCSRAGCCTVASGAA